MAESVEDKPTVFSVLYMLRCVNIPLLKLAVSWWRYIGIHDVQLLLPSTLMGKQQGLPCKLWYGPATLQTISSVMQSIENENVLICTSCIIPLNLYFFVRCQARQNRVVTFTRTMRKTSQLSWIVDYNIIQSSIIMLSQSDELMDYMKTRDTVFGNESLNTMILNLRLKVLHAYQMPVKASPLISEHSHITSATPFNVMDLTGTRYNDYDAAHGYAYVFVDNHRRSCPKITKENMKLLTQAVITDNWRTARNPHTRVAGPSL